MIQIDQLIDLTEGLPGRLKRIDDNPEYKNDDTDEDLFYSWQEDVDWIVDAADTVLTDPLTYFKGEVDEVKRKRLESAAINLFTGKNIDILNGWKQRIEDYPAIFKAFVDQGS